MKLATFTHDETTRIGVVDGAEIVDLSVASPDLPREMVALLAAGPGAMEAAREAVDGGLRLPRAAVRAGVKPRALSCSTCKAVLAI